MTTPPAPPSNLPTPAPLPDAPGTGFDIPTPGKVPQSKHAARWIFITIGIFIAVILIVAIGFIAYRFMASPNPVVIPSPISTPAFTPLVVIPSAIPVVPTMTPVPVPEGLSDVADPDEDGLTNAEERHYGTDTAKADTDGDGFKDSEEVRNGYNPLGSGKLDSDNDGFPDPDERKFGTDPFNPDTDRDGYSDGAEMSRGYNPLIASPNDKL